MEKKQNLPISYNYVARFIRFSQVKPTAPNTESLDTQFCHLILTISGYNFKYPKSKDAKQDNSKHGNLNHNGSRVKPFKFPNDKYQRQRTQQYTFDLILENREGITLRQGTPIQDVKDKDLPSPSFGGSINKGKLTTKLFNLTYLCRYWDIEEVIK